MTVALLVGFGALGALARYLTDSFISSRHRSSFPWGTLTVNVTGAFVLGVVTGLVLDHGLSEHGKVALGTGFCGAFTTFSTFAYEAVRLAEDGDPRASVGYVAASLAAGFAAAWVALSIT